MHVLLLSGCSWSVFEHEHEVKSQTHPILVLDDVLPYRCQGRPLTVVGGSDSAAFVGFEFAH